MYGFDVNKKLMPKIIQKKVNNVKNLTNGDLESLWIEIFKYQNCSADDADEPLLTDFTGKPIYDLGTMTIEEARNIVEDEMKNKGIEIGFSLLYKRYNRKRGR